MQKCAMVYKSHVSGELLSAIYDRILESKALSSVFYDGACRTFDEFLDTFNASDVHYWALFYEGELAGIAWLTGRVHKRAHGHFCMFQNVYGRSCEGVSKSVELARFVLSSWLRHKSGAGDEDYLLDVVVGITPKRNRMALKWLLRVGAVRCCEIPYGVWMADSGESETAVLSVITRESTDAEWMNK